MMNHFHYWVVQSLWLIKLYLWTFRTSPSLGNSLWIQSSSQSLLPRQFLSSAGCPTRLVNKLVMVVNRPKDSNQVVNEWGIHTHRLHMTTPISTMNSWRLTVTASSHRIRRCLFSQLCNRLPQVMCSSHDLLTTYSRYVDTYINYTYRYMYVRTYMYII